MISELDRQGAVNDYLANVLPEGAFEAVAALRGQPPGGYPYPLDTEIPAVRDAFRALLGTPAVRACLGALRTHDEVGPDRAITSAPTRPAPVTHGPELCPGPSDVIEFG